MFNVARCYSVSLDVARCYSALLKVIQSWNFCYHYRWTAFETRRAVLNALLYSRLKFRIFYFEPSILGICLDFCMKLAIQNLIHRTCDTCPATQWSRSTESHPMQTAETFTVFHTLNCFIRYKPDHMIHTNRVCSTDRHMCAVSL